jgi:hypothetical protein
MTLDTKFLPKKPQFFCEKCSFITNNKKDYNKHISTRKHLRMTEGLPKNPEKPQSFFCNCGKSYKYKQGLWKHTQKCNYINKTNETNEIIENNEPSSNIVLMLFQEQIKENKEFKEMIIEQNKQNQELQKQLIELSGKSNSCITNNITTNNKFNLNFFLNEQCKDALNITDFINSLTLKLTDLENFSKLGFAEGISKIFIRGLKELDIYKRPIHCSDLKREVLYVKDEDKWEKENDDKKKLKNVIHHISSKNINQIPEWVKQNPTCKDSDSKKNDVYLKMISNSMCGIDKAEVESNFNKIISNVVKEVIIEK